jgi:hypothetical protein
LRLGLRPLLRLREFRAESRRLLRGICRRPRGPSLRVLRRGRVSIGGWLTIIARMRFERGTVSRLCRA